MNENTRLQGQVEDHFRDYLGRECIYVPANRIGLYAALTTLLRPGDRVLITPQTDDVVLFVLFAAGVRPVMAPVDPADGNIDPGRVAPATWAALRAVITTNLYGVPDRVGEIRRQCDAHGLVWIEDAAHAMHSQVDGRPVGSFGDASIFSLSKHPHGVGGVLSFADPDLRREMIAVRDGNCGPRPLSMRIMDDLRPAIGAALARVHLREVVVNYRRKHGPGSRDGHRMPLLPEQLREEIRRGSELARFDPWVGFDLRDYRCEQPTAKLRRTVDWLRNRERDHAARIRGVERLRALPSISDAVRRSEPEGLFRVPLLVADREAAGKLLEAVGHPFSYVYAPPLDDYAGPEFVDSSPEPEAARWWARHAVPIDPLLAPGLPEDLFAQVPFQPAPPPPGSHATAPPVATDGAGDRMATPLPAAENLPAAH